MEARPAGGATTTFEGGCCAALPVPFAAIATAVASAARPCLTIWRPSRHGLQGAHHDPPSSRREVKSLLWHWLRRSCWGVFDAASEGASPDGSNKVAQGVVFWRSAAHPKGFFAHPFVGAEAE